ncbi:glycoside hydrolase family 31 protein [Pedobacter jamesrossensis]|uniref:DUF5110 domain-containing protein n=1 Tax=Pedobacter jamesrossensis TaxID=1908238 RepID=A0ABV8NTH6_9SPHI
MMRSHGTDIPREIYQFGKKGEPVYDAIESAINLRYSLLPYIYANANAVSQEQSTFMRALMMDFADDEKVLNINNEYMFGRSILVAPVINAQYTPEIPIKVNEETGWNKSDSLHKSLAVNVDFNQPKSKKVYLPKGAQWYDFWTNEKYQGGQEITKTTNLATIPLYIKAGTILPIGPNVQYATEKKWDFLEIRIYDGADGKFTLYEDENDNYNYENGAFSNIKFDWNSKKNTLNISSRQGNFSGMLENRKFKIIKIQANQEIKTASGKSFEKVITYSGKNISIKL